MILAENLSKIYKRGSESIHALDGVSVHVKQGEFVSFIGPSGSGKTTLLHLLGCLDNPSNGKLVVCDKEVFNNGKVLPENKLSEIRYNHFGYIFQKFYLVPTLTVLENITLPYAFGKTKADIDKAHSIAEKLGLQDRLKHLPKEISGGEMQRVAIARALINDPQIILADEPTGNLDSKRSDEISDILSSLNSQGITIVLVTHNVNLASRASRILELIDGKLR